MVSKGTRLYTMSETWIPVSHDWGPVSSRSNGGGYPLSPSLPYPRD